SLLARYWSEITDLIRVSQGTTLQILKHYGGPSALLQDPNASKRIYHFSRHQLKQETIQQIIDSARQTHGVVQTAWDIRYVCETGEQSVTLSKELRQLDKTFQLLVDRGTETLQQMRRAFGAATRSKVLKHHRFGYP
ncbi:MAG: hypothetical protein LBG58_06055, partial [Planctomycetaceae bacterium]|nr:hypothetical protein [Planctomycetaceae bacterium]